MNLNTISLPWVGNANQKKKPKNLGRNFNGNEDGWNVEWMKKWMDVLCFCRHWNESLGCYGSCDALCAQNQTTRQILRTKLCAPQCIAASIACNWDYIALFDRLLYAACTCVAVVALSLLSAMGSFSGPLSHSLRWKLPPMVTAARTGSFFSRVPKNWQRSNRRPYSGPAHDASSSGSSGSSAALVGNVGATQGSASQGRWRSELLNHLIHPCNFASWLIFFWFFALGTSMVLEFLLDEHILIQRESSVYFFDIWRGHCLLQ